MGYPGGPLGDQAGAVLAVVALEMAVALDSGCALDSAALLMLWFTAQCLLDF